MSGLDGSDGERLDSESCPSMHLNSAHATENAFAGPVAARRYDVWVQQRRIYHRPGQKVVYLLSLRLARRAECKYAFVARTLEQ